MNAKIFSLVIALVFATVSVAEETPAKKKRRGGAAGNNVANSVLKQLAKVELTEEQKTKIKELAKKSATEMKAAREEAGITPELMKKRAAALKEVRESGEKKKMADALVEVNKKIGLTEEQVAAFQKTSSARAELVKSAIALLSDEQKEKLPKGMLRAKKRGGQQANRKAAKKKKEEQ